MDEYTERVADMAKASASDKFCFYQPNMTLMTELLEGEEKQERENELDAYLADFAPNADVQWANGVLFKDLLIKKDRGGTEVGWIVIAFKAFPTTDRYEVRRRIASGMAHFYTKKPPPEALQQHYVGVMEFVRLKALHNVECGVDRTGKVEIQTKLGFFDFSDTYFVCQPVPPPFLFPAKPHIRLDDPTIADVLVAASVLTEGLSLYYYDGRPDGMASSWQMLQDAGAIDSDESIAHVMAHLPLHGNAVVQTRPQCLVTNKMAGLNVRRYRVAKDTSLRCAHVSLFRNASSDYIAENFADIVEFMRRAFLGGQTFEDVSCIVFWHQPEATDRDIGSNSDCTIVFLQDGGKRRARLDALYADGAIEIVSASVTRYDVLPGEAKNVMRSSYIADVLKRMQEEATQKNNKK